MPSPVCQDAIVFAVSLSIRRGPVVLTNVLVMCSTQFCFLRDEVYSPMAIILLVFASTLILS
jgi:hypothetical protein